MKINKKLLPIKAHYFLHSAGGAPVAPFIPVIAKGLGFSSVSVGWIFTVYPILNVFIKPLVGTWADKLNNKKVMFFSILLIQVIIQFLIQYVPPLPHSSEVLLNCDGNSTIQICSGKLREQCYLDRIIHTLNSTVECKIRLRPKRDYSVIALLNKNDSLNIMDKYYSEDSYVHLEDGEIQNGCISVHLRNETLLNALPPTCYGKQEALTVELFCENDLQDLITKPLIGDNEVWFTYQFWLLFILIVAFRILLSIGSSMGDAITFNLLGKKPENFGKQRMWGAVGWGLLSIVTGIVVDALSKGKYKKDFSIAFYLMLVISVFDLIIILFIDVKECQKSKSIMKDVRQLFNNPKIVIFSIWCIVSGVYVAFVWNFLFWFIEDLASRNGCTSNDWIKTLEGLVLTVHCYGGEIPLFFISGRILRKIGHPNAMTLVLLTVGLRFLLYSILTNPWWILPIETLNGITFGLFYATMTTYASIISPPGTETTVQNLVTSFFEGIGVSFGALLGGYLFKVIGTSQTFLVLGCTAVLLGILHALAQKFTNDTKKDNCYTVGVKKSNEMDNDEMKISTMSKFENVNTI